MLTRLLACGYMGAARLAELAYSQRNLEHAGTVREGSASRQVYPLIVALHAVVIVLTALRGGKPRRGWLVLLLAVQPVRAWVLLTLRERWNARGAVPGALEVETGGPYAYVRHPNYAVVIAELFLLPMAFRMRRLAFWATVANAGLLAVRIRDEEALLREAPAWSEHFETKKRFVPRVF